MEQWMGRTRKDPYLNENESIDPFLGLVWPGS